MTRHLALVFMLEITDRHFFNQRANYYHHYKIGILCTLHFIITGDQHNVNNFTNSEELHALFRYEVAHHRRMEISSLRSSSIFLNLSSEQTMTCSDTHFSQNVLADQKHPEQLNKCHRFGSALHR